MLGLLHLLILIQCCDNYLIKIREDLNEEYTDNVYINRLHEDHFNKNKFAAIKYMC